MKGRKPILCVWLPNATAEVAKRVEEAFGGKLADEYHVIVLSDNVSQKHKIELLGTRKLSKRKYQTILNAINK